jgi:hypothetical protein
MRIKQFAIGVAAMITLIGMNGCDSYDDGYDDGYHDGFYDGARRPDGAMTTLFLIDRNGFSLGGVSYSCINPSGIRTGDFVTAPNGEFSFIPGERCTFDFYGLYGTPEDPLFIEDDLGYGKGDIPYECIQDAGFTYENGSFEYIADDICTFYF